MNIKALLRKILSKRAVTKLNAIRNQVDFHIARICVKTRISSSLYYFLLNSQFRREHQAVLSGRMAYLESLVKINNSSILLRRNVHRLEKALIMEPRKPVFASDYIGETVDIYSKCIASINFDKNELSWANQVLKEYFSVVAFDKNIEAAHILFEQCKPLDNQVKSIPYQSSARSQSSINADELFELFKQRRSTRWFKEKTVAYAHIEQAVTMASQAPSACNRQPFSFYLFNDKSRAVEVAKCAMGTKGFAENIPSLVVIVGDLSSYPKEQDRHVPYIDGGLVAMEFMLALETLGLSSCPINWPDIEPYEVKLGKMLKLSHHLRPIMMIAIGYAKEDSGIPFSQKKSAAQLIKEVE